MNQKTIKILGGIFIVLLLAVTYPYWVGRLPSLTKQKPIPELDLTSFTESTTNTVIIKSPSQEITLSKKDNGWLVASFSASLTQVKNLITSLKDLETLSLVSKNPENQDEYGVSTDSGTLVAITGQRGEKNIIIGNQSSDTTSFYIREAKSSSVYLAKGDIYQKVQQSITDWRDKTIINADKTKLQKIEVKGKADFVLNLREGKWNVSNGIKSGELTATESAQLLDLFTPLEAYVFTTDSEKQEFAVANKTTVTLFNDKNEAVITLLVLLKDSNYWVQVSEQKEVYKLVSSKIAPLLNAADKLQ